MVQKILQLGMYVGRMSMPPLRKSRYSIGVGLGEEKGHSRNVAALEGLVC